jgi:serine/threonine protein kinase
VIDSKGHLKLTDYGLSEAGLIKKRQKEEEEKSFSKFMLQEIKKKQLRNNKEFIEKRVGSPYYMSPEVLLNEKVTKMSDWWSFGVMVYLSLTGDLPFKASISSGLEEITEAILKMKIWPDDMKFGLGEDSISYEAKDLI